MKDYQTSNLPLYGGSVTVHGASPAYVACQKTNSPWSALVRFKRSHGSDLKRISLSLATTDRACHPAVRMRTYRLARCWYCSLSFYSKGVFRVPPVFYYIPVFAFFPLEALSSPKALYSYSWAVSFFLHFSILHHYHSRKKEPSYFMGWAPPPQRGTRLFTSWADSISVKPAGICVHLVVCICRRLGITVCKPD